MAAIKRVMMNATFMLVVCVIAYALYVFPLVTVFDLIGFKQIPLISKVLASVGVAALIVIYLRTKITFRPLKWFVYLGMGVGFYAAMGAVLIQWVPFSTKTWLILYPSVMVVIGVIGYWKSKQLEWIDIERVTNKVTQKHHLVFISDVHLGSQSVDHLLRILREVEHKNPDALLIGGDLIDSSSFDLSQLSVLKMLTCPIYFVTGNHEYYLKDFQEKLNALSDYGIQIIDNQAVDCNQIQLIY